MYCEWSEELRRCQERRTCEERWSWGEEWQDDKRVKRGKSTAVLNGHSREVTKLVTNQAGDADPTSLATASLDGTVRVWDARTSEGVSHVFECPGAEFTALHFFPTGNAIAAGDQSGSVHIFDLRSHGTLMKMDNAKAQRASRCTGLACSLSGRALYTTHDDGTLNVWEPYGAQAGVVHSKLAYKSEPGAKTQPLSGLAISPDKSALAISCFDNSARVFMSL